jgi:hypothetical protein
VARRLSPTQSTRKYKHQVVKKKANAFQDATGTTRTPMPEVIIVPGAGDTSMAVGLTRAAPSATAENIKAVKTMGPEAFGEVTMSMAATAASRGAATAATRACSTVGGGAWQWQKKLSNINFCHMQHNP